MKWMFICLCCAGFLASPLGAQEVSPRAFSDDPYSLKEVKNLLAMSKDYLSRTFELSIEGKELWRESTLLGDGVSVGILKIVDAQDLTKPEIVRAYLLLARLAFSKLDRVALPANRNPAVTLFLLGYLRDKVHDPKVTTEIESVIILVRSQTSAESSSARP